MPHSTSGGCQINHNVKICVRWERKRSRAAWASWRGMELETGGWRGLDCCELPAPSTGAMVRSQVELPLKAISSFVAVQLQELLSMSMDYIINRKHGTAPGWASFWEPHGFTGAVVNCPCPLQDVGSGGLVPYLTTLPLVRTGSEPYLRQYSGAGPGVRGMSNWALSAWE